MKRIILVGATKGGVGKTVMAVQLATALARCGERVVMVDGDAQGTARDAMALRDKADPSGQIPCRYCPDPASLQEAVKSAGADYVVIDAGGRDSAALRAAMMCADTMLIPCPPSSFDVWALDDIGALVKAAQAARSGSPLRVLAFLSRANAGAFSSDNREAQEALASLDWCKPLKTIIVQRKAFAMASAEGKTVMDMVPRNQKAHDEIGKIIHEIFERNKWL